MVGMSSPAAITLSTYGAARKREDEVLRFFSGNFEDKGIIEVPLENLHFEKEHNWTNYPKACSTSCKKLVMSLIAEWMSMSTVIFQMDLVFLLQLPFELLIGVIAEKLYDLHLDRLDLVKIGKQTENHFIGVNSGIMDQFAIGMGADQRAVYLDTNT